MLIALWIIQEHPFLSMYDDLNIDLASYFTNAGSPLTTLLVSPVVSLWSNATAELYDAYLDGSVGKVASLANLGLHLEVVAVLHGFCCSDCSFKLKSWTTYLRTSGTPWLSSMWTWSKAVSGSSWGWLDKCYRLTVISIKCSSFVRTYQSNVEGQQGRLLFDNHVLYIATFMNEVQ